MTKNLLMFLIKTYQFAISPLIGNRCRFYPSCSQYAVLAVEKYGAFKGLSLAVKRVLKCRPGNKGGVDLV
jgi:putative membrane protein insertion efficiency factor